ncbi:DUF2157 domain-containing protein [Oceanobacillus sp. CAU 1775]
MKRRELEREGKSWVAEGIITEEQLEKILKRKENDNPNYIIILFAVLLTGLGFLTFIMSDWAREQHISRVIIIIAVTLFLYILGDVLYRKRGDLFGVSFIVLGYIVFGTGMLLVIDIYNISVYTSWPFIIWTIVGLGLYYIYRHILVFAVAIIVNTFGQLYSGMAHLDSNWFLLLFIVLGFGYFIFKEKNAIYSYFFAIGVVIQMIVVTNTAFDAFYYYIILIFPLYLISMVIKEDSIRLPLKYISLAAIFIFGMFQTFMLQENWFTDEVTFEFTFFIIWLIFFITGITFKLKEKRPEELIELVLFLPIVYLPIAYLIGLISLFVFSLGWIFVGYLKNKQQYIMLGTGAFLFSTFTAYVQFAWDAIDRSLFFFIGGILLFVISFIIERQRRQLSNLNKGSEGE